MIWIARITFIVFLFSISQLSSAEFGFGVGLPEHLRKIDMVVKQGSVNPNTTASLSLRKSPFHFWSNFTITGLGGDSYLKYLGNPMANNKCRGDFPKNENCSYYDRIYDITIWFRKGNHQANGENILYRQAIKLSTSVTGFNALNGPPGTDWWIVPSEALLADQCGISIRGEGPGGPTHGTTAFGGAMGRPENSYKLCTPTGLGTNTKRIN